MEVPSGPFQVGRPKWLRADTIVGGLIVAAFLLAAIAPGTLATHDPLTSWPDGLTASGAPRPPGEAGFLLGTDVLGRDVFSRVVYGARVAVLIAVVPNLIALAFAALVALTAGYRRGIAEAILMRLTEAFLVLPLFLIAMAVIATFGSSTTTILLTLAMVSWSYPARVLHGEVRRLANAPHVEAARSLGAGPIRITLRHILPHLTTLIMVYFTMNAAYMVMLEAGLAFLGFGVQPPTPSWGLMLADARDQFFRPWLIIVPGISLALLCIGLSLLGNISERNTPFNSRRVLL
jgi:peptide/nickel transport system permease protein